MSTSTALRGFAILATSLMACGGGGGGVRVDASKSGDLSIVFNGPDLSGGGPRDFSLPFEQVDFSMGGGGNCTATASYGAVGTVVGGARGGPDMNGNDTLQWLGSLENMDTGDLLDLELYANMGVFAGSSALKTGTFQLAGDDLNYETCGLCVLVYTDTDGQGAFADTYMATAGTVKLTSVAGQIAGTISNAKFEHVDIDANTYHSTPVNDGCKSGVTSISFNDMIQ